jgi:predicted nucleotidyltransferase
MPLPPYEIELLTEAFRQFPEIRAVYVFGSAATGTRRSDSDLDLAVLASDESFQTHKLDVLAALTRQGFDNIDLVFLNTADTVTQYEAVRLNKLIYSTADFDRGYYYSKIVREYLDLLPYLDVQRKAYKERLLGGQT